MKYGLLLGLLLGASSAAAQTFHIEPANPVLIGEPMSIRLDNLPSGEDVTVVAERTMTRPSRPTRRCSIDRKRCFRRRKGRSISQRRSQRRALIPAPTFAACSGR